MFNHITFVYNFFDSATVWSYNLISVHHDIFWFIIIILSLVYWSLYKILKENSWNSFNKQSGLLNFFFYSSHIFMYIECIVFWLWIRNFFIFLVCYYNFVIEFLYFVERRGIFRSQVSNYIVDLLFGTLGSNIYSETDLYFPVEIVDWCDWVDLKKFFKEKYISYLLYSYPTNAILFNDREEDFLTVHRFNDSTPLEFVFAIFPTVIIAMILLPSIYLLYSLDENLDPKFSVKIIGHQWFWSYEFDDLVKMKVKLSRKLYDYSWIKKPLFHKQIADLHNTLERPSHLSPPFTFPDDFYLLLEAMYNRTRKKCPNFKMPARIALINHFNNLSYESIFVQEEDLLFGSKRLLEVDNRLVLPVNVTLRLIITSADVLHSWAVPELGIKVDAVPGRLNQFITLICKPGIYYGQCSELCGVSHGFMPIVIHAIPYKQFLLFYKDIYNIK